MTVPASQKALLLNEPFGTYSVGTRPVIHPGPGEVLIKVKAAALNPVDWKIQKYNIFVQEYPAVLGTDAAGDIAEIGEGVKGFEVGDRVFTQGIFANNGATFQEYIIASAPTTAKIPGNFTYEEASTVSLGLNTAYLGFYHHKPYGWGLATPVNLSGRGKYKNIPILIVGGSSSVGQFAIQLAKLSGFSPIITTSSLTHADFLKTLGATHVIDRRVSLSDGLAEVLRGDKKIEYIYDAISSAETQQLAYDVIAPGGNLLITLPPAFKAKDGDNEGKEVIAVSAPRDLPHNLDALAQLFTTVSSWLSEQIIQPNRLQVLEGGLQAIPGGLDRLEKDQVSGIKLVVRPQDTE